MRRRHRRCVLPKIVIVLLVLAGLWLAVELVAPRLVEARIEERARTQTEGAAEVSADVDSFPLVTRLAFTGKVKRVTVTLDQVARQRFTFTDFTVVVHGTEFDRSALLNREVEVLEIESGTISASLEGSTLSDALGTLLRLRPGGVGVSVQDGTLVVGREGGPGLRVPLPPDLFPCSPTAVVQEGRILVSCTITEVPPQLVQAANDA